MFNPGPRIQAVPIVDRHVCYVIDDALADPDAWVEYAAAHRDEFTVTAHNAYPGPELRLPDAASARLDEFFATHVRGLLGARRTLRMYSRLAIADRAPDALEPRQWVCHRDRMGMAPDHCALASVLYLFRDEGFGGTSFFVPKRPLADVERMIDDSAALGRDEFASRYGIRSGYMTGSNEWFEQVRTIPARWNRIIFYDGSLFHCGAIGRTEALTADPRHGRLTLNGFFTCRRRVS
jgi:hypothetical protein